MTARFVHGALIASLAAGPVVALPVVVGGVAMEKSLTIEAVATLPFILFVALVVGTAVSVLPNLMGAALLGWAGGRHPHFRHPAVWGVAGLILGTLIALLWLGQDSTLGTTPALLTADLLFGALFTALFAATGGVCALVCRHFTTWDD